MCYQMIVYSIPYHFMIPLRTLVLIIYTLHLVFSLVLNSVHVYKSRSSIREIIPNAHFEKNQFFTKMKVVVDF